VPGKPTHVLVRIIGSEIVEEQEGIVLLRWTETDGTMQMNACSFDGGATLENLAYTSGVWHECLLSRRSTAPPHQSRRVACDRTGLIECEKHGMYSDVCASHDAPDRRMTSASVARVVKISNNLATPVL
jgi:hypothetical protein